MFLDRKTYDDLRQDYAQLQGEAKGLYAELAFLRTTLDCMRVRLNQVEHERAQMIYNYTGVKVKSPSFEKETEHIPGTNMRQGSISDVLASTAAFFNDVGDMEAAKQGIDWDDTGNVHYATQD